jgi:predicted RNase H-like HicB family nuclease
MRKQGHGAKGLKDSLASARNELGGVDPILQNCAPAPARLSICVLSRYTINVRLTVEVEGEADGRWLAEIPALPGVMAYGDTREAALAAVKAFALRTIADRAEHCELGTLPDNISFAA